MKNKIALFFFILLILPINVLARSNYIAEEYQVNLYRARVIEIVEEIEINNTIIQVVKIEILNRDLRGSEVIINNTLLNNDNDINLRIGNRISVHMELDNDGETNFFLHGRDRQGAIFLLCLIFVICVLVLGRTKGLRALIALTVTISLILFGLVPLLLQGYNPIILSIITCIIAAILIFAICYGLNKKSIAAIIGVAGGLLVAGVFAWVFGILANISGIAHGDAQMLQYLPGGYLFDFRGILFAGIIIGSLGAITDVSISLSSSLIEIKTHNPNISNKELLKSGANIGRDIMGSMINTLILAYTGSALATILIFVGFEAGFNEIINLESISTEIIRAISGSIGLLFAMPFTILAFIFLNKKEETVDKKSKKGELNEGTKNRKNNKKNR